MSFYTDMALRFDRAHIAIAGDAPVSLGDLARFEAELCAQLEAIGFGPGARIGVMLPDHWTTLAVLTSLMQRWTVIPLNPALKSADLDDLPEMDVVLVGAQDANRSLGRPRVLLEGGPSVEVTFDSGPAPKHLPSTREANPGVILLTSGSTGIPKQVFLTADMCMGSARTIAASLQLGTDDVALHALPMFHIGAIVDLWLAPLLAGGAVRIARAKTPHDLARAARCGATWMQLVPTMLTRCLAELPHEIGQDMGARLRFIRSVSADLAPHKQAQAEAFFGQTPLIQIYGMTETSGQIAANPLPPGTRKPGSVGRPDGAEVQIVDLSGAPAPVGSEGEVCVRGRHVITAYEAGGGGQDFIGEWLKTGDLGRLDPDGFLTLTGRKKDIINRGGEKIAPQDIERAALRLPGVLSAAAYALPHPTLGEQPALAVVLEEGTEPDEDAVLAALSAELAAFKCPRLIRFLPHMPLLGSGKIDKQALKEAGRLESAVSPQDWHGEAGEIAAIWARILELSGPPPANQDFFDAGGDSLSAVELMAQLQRRLGRAIPPNALMEAPRFGDFVARLEKERSKTEEPAHIAFLRRQTFGWPGRDVGAAIAMRAENLLAGGVPLFYCSQGETEALRDANEGQRTIYFLRSLAGFSGRDESHNQDIAARFANEIARLYPEGPVFLMGFCEGAKILDLTARDLMARGRQIGAFVSIDKWFESPVPYPAVYVGSRSRKHSVLMRYAYPEFGFGHLCPAGGETLALPGKHLGALTPDGLAQILARLDGLISGAKPIRQHVPVGPSAPEDRARLARGDIDLRQTGREAEARRIAVAIENKSAAAWLPSAQGGLTVELRWRHLDGSPVLKRAATLTWEAEIAPGARHEVEVDIDTYPAPLGLILYGRFVDQGFGAHRAQNLWRSWTYLRP